MKNYRSISLLDVCDYDVWKSLVLFVGLRFPAHKEINNNNNTSILSNEP